MKIKLCLISNIILLLNYIDHCTDELLSDSTTESASTKTASPVRSLYSQSTASTTSDPASTLISQLNNTMLAKKTSEMYRSKLNRLLKKKVKSPIANVLFAVIAII